MSEPGWVAAGGLTSYGADFRLTGTQAAGLVAKVLQGTAPADIPIELPGDMLLSVNLATAKAIGLTIPRYILERADLVYQ